MRACLIAAMLTFLLPIIGRAQPFVGQGVSAFTPEIAVVNAGVVTDVQPVVSPDRKYVTLNVRTQHSELMNLYQFQFQQGTPLVPGLVGFVGGVQFAPPEGPGSGAFGAINPAARLAPGRGAAILQQRGMTRIIGP